MTVVSPLIPLLAKQARSSPEVTVHVEMKRCAAYEITTLVRKKIVMETNPAYEQVTMSTLKPRLHLPIRIKLILISSAFTLSV